MYAGHFAAGLAMKAAEPRVPTWVLLLGVGFLDVLFGIFVLLGIERVTMMPGQSPGFSLDFIDWSHSLAASIFWSVLFGLAFLRRGRLVALWAGLAVFSHFVLDVFMHPPDLALWPHATAHVGLGLWRLWPHGWWWFELAFIAVFCAYYVVRARRDRTFGGRSLAACAMVLLLHIGNSPWAASGR
jgi:membrane-bound metal-dependent hydrolase YbcI (DUF457 family)